MPPAVLHKESERVLELLDLSVAAGRPIRSYSKGMVQRLGLAQALHDPDLYVDQPMSGLDPIGRALVRRLFLTSKSRVKRFFLAPM